MFVIWKALKFSYIHIKKFMHASARFSILSLRFSSIPLLMLHFSTYSASSIPHFPLVLTLSKTFQKSPLDSLFTPGLNVLGWPKNLTGTWQQK